MKATVFKAELLPAVELICKVVEAKTTLPILSSVMLSTEEGGVTLRATDLDLELIVFVPSPKIEVEGAVLMPAKTLLNVVRALEDEEIVIEGPEKGKVSVGPAKFQTPGNVADMPVPMRMIEVKDTTAGFVRAMRAVMFAASTDETRFVLNGVLYDRGADATRLVTTDGHRLAVIPTPELYVGSVPKETHIVMPTKAAIVLSEMEKKFPKRTISAGFDDGRGDGKRKPEPGPMLGKFRVGPARLTFRCIDGQFPEYQQVVPKDDRDEFVVQVDRKRFEKALKLAASMTKTHGVKVCINGALRLDTNDPDIGEVSQEVDASIRKKIDGSTEVTAGFNVMYLLDACKHLPKSAEGDEISLAVDDEHAPARMKSGDMCYIVMPMRV
jgi:DNA polymerase-3 subunit beta